MFLIKNKISIGVILYLIPFAVGWYIFFLVSKEIRYSHSFENSLIAYGAYIFLLILSFIGSIIIARDGKQRKWWVKFLFSIIALFQFLPVMLLAIVGAGSIYLNNQLIEVAPVSLYYRMKYSKFGCTVTSILASVSAFSLMLFIVERGNVKTTRNIKKAVFAVLHIGSGDYFVAALLAIFHNWRVMIGANLWKYKIFHWFFNAVGIPIEREQDANGNLKRIEAIRVSKEFLSNSKDCRLVVFPQGTRERNPENGFHGLKAGAFKIAKELGLPVIPVTIIGTNVWRKPWKQDTTSQKGKKQNFVKLFASYAYQFFKTGINPTITKVIYGNPISTFDKTIDEIKSEVEEVMNKTYFAYTKGKRKDRKKI